MNARERVYAAVEYRPPDIVPLECHPSPAGLYEHGGKLKDLWKRYPQDFGDFSDMPITRPAPDELDAEGNYNTFRRDEWGVLWQERIFGVRGHPIQRPLDDLGNLDSWKVADALVIDGADFEADREESRRHMEKWFLKGGGISVFEVMQAVRRFEDVLMDIALDTAEINRIADIICERQERMLQYCLSCGVDAIQFGDDFGTQSSLILSVSAWRRFFKPRYQRLFAPVKAAGVKLFFHSCGCVADLLPELADLGVDAVWPQLNVYDLSWLAQRCRELHLAVALHPERSHLMTNGSPAQVRKSIDLLVDTFRPQEGGSWFYVEIDNGFPLANVEALFEAVGSYR